MPQAIKNILPALGNEFVTIVKDSSLLSTIGVMELWNGAQTVQSTSYIPLTPLVFAASYYLIMTTVLTVIIQSFEKKLNKEGSSMSNAIISIKDLHKYFGKNEVLKGIDLDIQQGQVVVIIGPSGSGNRLSYVQ